MHQALRQKRFDLLTETKNLETSKKMNNQEKEAFRKSAKITLFFRYKN